jgi:uncharacterized ferritin-like protein (DUF455 family)
VTPPAGTIERWAWDYISASELGMKLAPEAPPARWEDDAPERRVLAPGRPAELRVSGRAEKTRGLQAPSGRARALHTFLHHELQAAELMAWAILAFPTAPTAFREGLLRIALDECRHMRMYAERIEALGYSVGAFPVRDWFWTRVPTCADPASFVAVMGLGLESANLEHAASFAARFREAGDDESARVQELVGLEEIAHVRFGVRWFGRLASEGDGELEFDAWRRALPPPLTPLLMRGRPLRREARRRAGQPEPFLDALDAWEP